MFAIVLVFTTLVSESAAARVDVTNIKEKILTLDGKKVVRNTCRQPCNGSHECTGYCNVCYLYSRTCQPNIRR